MLLLVLFEGDLRVNDVTSTRSLFPMNVYEAGGATQAEALEGFSMEHVVLEWCSSSFTTTCSITSITCKNYVL